jgi:thioesterase domain-containing protein
VPRLAEHYIQAMRHVQPEGPYWLGGHSFGGRVAFEMARTLEGLGQTVKQLVLFDCIAPPPAEESYDWDETLLLIAFASASGLDIAGSVDWLSGIITDADLDHRLERTLRALQQHHLVLPDTRLVRFKGLFQVFNTNNQIAYIPAGPIHTDIVLFKARDWQPRSVDEPAIRQGIADPAVLASLEALHRTWRQLNERESRLRQDAQLDWDRYTTAAVMAYDMPGDHMTLVRDPYVQDLARSMQGVRPAC